MTPKKKSPPKKNLSGRKKKVSKSLKVSPLLTSGDEKNSDSQKKLGFNTTVLHADIKSGTEHGAIHHGVQPSVTYGHQDVRDLISVFQNRKKGYAYSRNSSPSISALERQITLLEGGRSSLVFSTGLAAVASTFLSLLKVGDHIVSSCHIFGNTHGFFNTLIRLGFRVDFVDVSDTDNISRALTPKTKFFFAETIANPGTQIPNWVGISKVLKKHEKRGRKIVSIIDNTLTTPYLFRPQEWGFSFSVNSLTKYMAGQGSVLAGSLTDLGNWQGNKDENILLKYKKLQPKDCQMIQVRKKGMRDLGPTLSPYAAHQVALGLETLSLRMEKHIANAQVVAEFLHLHPKVKVVHYPGLKSHPHYSRAQEWYRGRGALLSFVLCNQSPSKKKSDSSKNEKTLIHFLNSLQLIIKSSHLGDTRTLAIPVAKTIFHEMGLKMRKTMGIDENQIRLSVGIEDPVDIIADLSQAFEKI